MLHPGNGTGDTRIIGGNPCQNHTFHNGTHGLRIPLHDPGSVVGALFQSGADHISHIATIVFAVNHTGQLPFPDADIFCRHVTNTGLNHAHGRSGQNIQIAHNNIGTFTVQRHLQPITDHGRRGGRITVHGGSGTNDHIRLFRHIGNNFADIVQASGANRDYHIAGRIKMHHSGADGTLVGLEPFPGETMGFIGNICRLQNLQYPLPCGFVSIFIEEHKNLLRIVLTDQFRNFIQRSKINQNATHLCIMRFSARTGETVLCKKRLNIGFNSHFQYTPVCFIHYIIAHFSLIVN